jgi:hypothetical protein
MRVRYLETYPESPSMSAGDACNNELGIPSRQLDRFPYRAFGIHGTHVHVARRYSLATVLVPRYGYFDLFEIQYITPEKRIGVYRGRKIRAQNRQHCDTNVLII